MSIIKRSKQVDRNSLFYNQFHFQCKFHVPEASALRKLNHGEIDKTVYFRNSWTKNRVSDETKNRLHAICDQFHALKNPFKLTISSNWIYFYTSNLEDIDELALGAIGKPLWGEITKVNVTHGKNEVGLQNPFFKFRTYVREHKPSPQEIENLTTFVESAAGELRASPGLVEFLKKSGQRVWINNGYFFDHNEMNMVTALALINPKLIRKTMPIVKVNS